MSREPNMTDKTEFWNQLGYAVAIIAVCLGVGTCTLMVKMGDAAIERAKVEGQK